MRTVRLLVVLPVAAAAVVLGTAAPGTAAGSAKNTVHAASLAFGAGGGVAGTLSGAHLTDYVSGEYYDRVGGSPVDPERVVLQTPGDASVGDVTCRLGSAYQSAISVYGETKTWASLPLGTEIGARVEIACLRNDGSQHRLHWGNRMASNGTYDTTLTSNCVRLLRSSAQTFTLTATDACVVQDEVVNTRNRWVTEPSYYGLAFTATLTVPTLR